MADQSPLALRPREAAKLLSISERTLFEWCKHGLIPHRKIAVGKRAVVLFSVAELERWLAERSTSAEGGKV